jgi:Tropinone reductase 1
MVESLKQQYPFTNIIHVACDVSTKQGRTVLVEAAKEHFGGGTTTTGVVHGLVNNVGINIRKPVLEQTEEEFHNMIKTNVESAYFLCQMFSDLFDPAGATIVNVSSSAGVQSSGTGAAYGLSKAALNQYTKILACEWAARKIRVNAVAPW